MSHLRRSSTRSAARIGRPVRLLSILIAATLVAGCLAYVAITTMATGPRTPAALAALAARTGQASTAAPAKAAAGAAAAASGGGRRRRRRRCRPRRPAGRPSSRTASPARPAPRPRGQLVLRHRQRLRNGRDRAHHQLDRQRLPGRPRASRAEGDPRRRQLDVGQDRVRPRRLPGPARRRARADRVDRAAGPGRRPRLLARVLGARVAHADRRRLADVGRARPDGGRQRAQPGLADAARRGGQRRPPADRLPRRAVRVRLPHLLGDR